MELPLPKRLKGESPSHARSRQQEQEAAKRIGGRVTKASGALHEKGDVRKPGIVRIENKTTKHESFRATKEMLEKIEMAVAGTGELPVIEVELELSKHRAYVIPADALDTILE